MSTHVSELTQRTGERTKTAPAAAPLVLQLRLNAQVMKTALEGLDPGELTTRVTPQTNSMLWIFGHAVATRAQMLGLLGRQFETGFGKRFDRGAKAEEADDLTMAEIDSVHSAIAEHLEARLAAITAEELERPATGPQLPGARTLADQLAFFSFHESYHVGQMGYIRKALGHSAVAG